MRPAVRRAPRAVPAAGSRAGRTAGLTLTEVMVSVALVGVLATIPALLYLPSVQSDANARQRSLATRAAETWLDRYRAAQEPQVATGSVCAVSGSVITCTYPYNYSYPSSDWNTHTPQLASQMAPFRHVVTITWLASGGNMVLRNVQAQTYWREGRNERSVALTTRMAY